MIETKIRQLLAGVTAEADLHLAEVEADLDQTRALLAEAVDKLGSAFIAIHADITAQQEWLNQSATAGGVTDTASELAALRERLAEHVGVAVTGLQFQDLVNQIVERAQHRIEGVRHTLTALGNGASALQDDSHATENTLGNLNRAVADSSQALRHRLRRQVDQHRLDCGDIELF